MEPCPATSARPFAMIVSKNYVKVGNEYARPADLGFGKNNPPSAPRFKFYPGFIIEVIDDKPRGDGRNQGLSHQLPVSLLPRGSPQLRALDKSPAGAMASDTLQETQEGAGADETSGAPEGKFMVLKRRKGGDEADIVFLTGQVGLEEAWAKVEQRVRSEVMTSVREADRSERVLELLKEKADLTVKIMRRDDSRFYTLRNGDVITFVGLAETERDSE